MPHCNGADRGCACEAVWGNRLDLLLSLSTSGATSPCRESGQTSLWSGVTREPGKQASGGDADMSAAETLAGAVPSHGNMSCLLQASIVKVSSGKRRRAESVRFDRTVVQFWCREGGSTSPHGWLGVTAHQGEPESDGLPRGGDRSFRPSSAAVA
jgi:hypothetical protein